MVEPSINSLLEKVDNLYMLCNAAGKRARQLVSGAQKLTEAEAHSEVTIATNEIEEKKIICIKTCR